MKPPLLSKPFKIVYIKIELASIFATMDSKLNPEETATQGVVKNSVPQEIIKTLRRSRGIFKRKITLLLKQLKELTQTDSLTPSLSKSLTNKIELEMVQVRHYDDTINKVMDQTDLESKDETYYASELEDQMNFSL